MKRILVLSHSSAIGGATASLDTVLDDLSSAGFAFRILTPAGPMAEKWRSLGYEVTIWKPPSCAWLGGFVYSSGLVRFHVIQLVLLALLPIRLWKARRMVSRELKSCAAEFVYVNSITLWPLGLVFPGSFRGQTPTVVWHLREVLNARLFSPARRLVRWCLTHATDKLLAITTNEEVGFKDFKDVRVVHNTIPVSWRDREEADSAEPDDEHVRVIMVAMMSPGKGFQDYLEVALELAEKYPETQFDLYTPRAPHPFHARFKGYPETEAFLENVLANLESIELRKGVRWWFGQELTSELFQSYDLYVRPDRAGCPWGRDVLEAMWRGLPIVATGSCDEFVKEGETGYLVLPGDTNALADQIGLLIERGEERREMSAKAGALARTLFDPTLHRRKILEAFDSDPV